MNMPVLSVSGILLCFFLTALVGGVAALESSSSNGNIISTVCPANDEACSLDPLGYEAIKRLHLQIDDDKNGNLDWEESDEFVREELEYEDNFERQARFHGNDDHITVDDLWFLWVKSDVYNWTVDDVLDWLVTQVELPQYVDSFRINEVGGRILPRLASNGQYLTSILGIKTPVHRQKIALKSTDTVLFGPPRRHNYVKDVALVASLLIAIGGCWLAYVQHKYSQSHLKKVMKDLDTLQSAEESLKELQSKLDLAEREQRSVVEEKKTLENQLKNEVNTSKSEAERLRVTRETTAEEIGRLKLAEEELVQVRLALSDAEYELEVRGHGGSLVELQPWLQLTHEIEMKNFDAKKEAADKQLLLAKEMCEKIRRKRGAFLGSIRMAHTNSIDDTDTKIMSTKAALEDVKMDLAERSHRWQHIEKICGFNITTNPGIQYLDSLLLSTGHPSSSLSTHSPGYVPVDEADEDQATGPLASQVAYMAMGATPHMTQSLHSLQGERQVFPNLMKAGMQLSLFGLGLQDPRLRGSLVSVPSDVGHLRQRLSCYSESSNSINAHSINPRSKVLAANSMTRSTTLPLSRRHENGNISEDSEESNVSNKPNVAFQLGDYSTTENESKVLVTTQSLDLSQSKPRPPRSLTTSLSEGTLKSVPPIVRSRSGKSLGTMGEESSSPEDSTDSAPKDESKKEKRKKKLFQKLLRPSRKT